ncbi:MAG: C4-type zinc ribbon domain-containing protein [Candidatus Zixiibacteriota bacterium]
MVIEKELEMLLRLQSVDYDLGELDRSKDYLPEMINNLEHEIADTRTALEASEKELTEQNLLNMRLDLELTTLNQELAKFQKQMMIIKTNKEYDAITNEIANRKVRISEIEEEILKALTQIDDLKEKIQEYKGKLEEIEKRNEDELVHLREELGSIDDKIKIKEGDRKNITVRIDKKLLATYERVKKGRGNQVVVTIKKRACGACYKGIPPQVIQEMRKGEIIYTCDNCGRILLWNEDSG